MGYDNRLQNEDEGYSDMFGLTVYEQAIGSLSYQIKKPTQGQFTLWLGGCRIGKPRTNGDVWEFTAKTLEEAKEEMRASAKRELQKRLRRVRAEARLLRIELEKLR